MASVTSTNEKADRGGWRQEERGGPSYVLRIALPVGSPDSSPAAKAAPSALPLRVLVADNEAASRKTLVLMLERMGCQTAEAASGLGALRLLAERRYDVVFLGLHMAEMDGFATARFISQHWSGEEIPRLVALVSEGAEEDAQEARRAGFVRLVTKPVRAESLEQALAPD
jgi:CheY-like chemotaxis protein